MMAHAAGTQKVPTGLALGTTAGAGSKFIVFAGLPFPASVLQPLLRLPEVTQQGTTVLRL